MPHSDRTGEWAADSLAVPVAYCLLHGLPGLSAGVKGSGTLQAPYSFTLFGRIIFCILLWGYVGIPLGVPEHRDRNLELTDMRELKLNSAAPDEADEREDNRSPIDQPEQEDDDLLPTKTVQAMKTSFSKLS